MGAKSFTEMASSLKPRTPAPEAVTVQPPKAAPVKKAAKKNTTAKTGTAKTSAKHYKPDTARRTHHIDVSVTPDTGAALKTAAQAAGTSVNEFINQAILKYLKRGRKQ